MFAVRIHGRGGQGAVTAAELLSVAAFDEGRHAQAFPTFGSERTGAPVVSFCRIDDRAIRLREPITDPDALIVQDPTLLHQVNLFAGLKSDGFLLLNTSRTLDELGLEDLVQRLTLEHVVTVPATEIAREHLGRPLPNAALLGAFAALTGQVSLGAVCDAIRDRFPGEVGERQRPGRRGRPRARPRVPEEADRCLARSRARRRWPAPSTLCRPEVIAAYPISPQTHIVESLSDRVRTGELASCEYLMVESEFGAMSACIGASGAGARTYTATSSQGLLFMAEALFNASGLGLPIVMTVANRAIGAPINIWNDHSDAMSMRDSGWIQLYAESNQEAVDLHIQAYRLAESLSVPVMVCMDGFVLTHAFEQVDLPTQEQVDAFLPPFVPQQMLDPDDPVTIGAMVGPEAFAEVKYLMHAKQMAALDEIPLIADEFRAAFGRSSGGLLKPYRVEDAETVVVALGSVLGTIEEVVDGLRDEGVSVGVLGITCFRPVAGRGGARGAAPREAGDRRGEGVRGRGRRHRRPEHPRRHSGPPGGGVRRRGGTRRSTDHPRVAAATPRRGARGAGRPPAPALPRPRLRARPARAREVPTRQATGPARRTHAARHRHRRIRRVRVGG